MIANIFRIKYNKNMKLVFKFLILSIFFFGLKKFNLFMFFENCL